MKKTTTLLLTALLLVSIAGCGNNATTNDSAKNTTDSSSTSKSSKSSTTSTTTEVTPISISAEDSDSSWDENTATKIVLGESISVDGNGASVASNVVTITTTGTYVVSGSISDGQILVNATKDDVVHLVLNGTQITNTSGAPIYAPQCDKLIVTLANGTQNTITDGGSGFTYADTTEEEPNAALFSKDDLSINGTGALTVNAGFNNGIGTKDDLIIAGGTFTINAANHGIRGNDSVAIADGTFTINAKGKGIVTHNEEKGTMDIKGGTFTIDSEDDSLHSTGNLILSGGTFTLASGDDGVHADGTLAISDGNINVAKSYEGLEGSDINISGGTIVVHATDDGINAAGGSDGNVEGGSFGKDVFRSDSSHTMTISGGVVTVYSGSDGLDSNGTLAVSGGTVAVFINAPRDGDATDTDNGGTILPALYGNTTIKSGTQIAVGDWSIVAEADATSFCLILPGLVNGQNYSITANGAELSNVTATTTIAGMDGGRNAGGIGGGPGRGGADGAEKGTPPGDAAPDGSTKPTPPSGNSSDGSTKASGKTSDGTVKKSGGTN
ncbi:hypothetical protein FACS1894111_12330 [Clostridia bacterium]|nr:hypothetical protein FACS1894111_12330 [Clostridia bacterium]